MNNEQLPATPGASGEDPRAKPLPSGRFAGREEFAKLIRDALQTAATEGWREIILSDATFEDWPLRERVVVESLQAWSKTGRRMTLLAKSFDVVMRSQPRFVAWRRTWSHIIECRACRTVDALDFPSVLWSGSWVLQRLELQHSTGFCGAEPERRLRLRELLDERLRVSTPAFAASTLGL